MTMKITKSQLKSLIKEAILLKEGYTDEDVDDVLNAAQRAYKLLESSKWYRHEDNVRHDLKYDELGFPRDLQLKLEQARRAITAVIDECASVQARAAETDARWIGRK